MSNKKIIINSHVSYHVPLTKCLNSLAETGFKNFHDVIVVRSGSSKDVSPQTVSASNVEKDIHCNEQIVLIETKLNNLDYTMYHELGKHYDNELVNAKQYLCTLDTVTFAKDFVEQFNKLNVDDDEVLTCKSPHSNICAIHSNVVSLYKDNFSLCQLNKEQAIKLEMFDEIPGVPLKSITKFGKRMFLKPRIQMSSKDIYKQNILRGCFYYEEFGIYKWVNGNFTGQYKLIPNDIF